MRKIKIACILILLVCVPIGFCDAEEKIFTISTSYESLLSNPERTGMLDRLMQEAFRRIGWQVRIVFNPTERSLADVNAGLLDGEMNRIEGMGKTSPTWCGCPRRT